MTRSITSRPSRCETHTTGTPVTLEELEVLACACGPGTTDADLQRIREFGPGWSAGLEKWRRTTAPYALLVAQSFDGGSRAAPRLVTAASRVA